MSARPESPVAIPADSIFAPFYSSSTLTVILTTFFVACSFLTMWYVCLILSPNYCPLSEKYIKPTWDKSTKFQISIFVSAAEDDRNYEQIWSADEVDISTSFEANLNVSLPQTILEDSSVYMHVFLSPSNAEVNATSLPQCELSETSVSSAPLTRHLVRKSEVDNMLTDESPSGANYKPEKQNVSGKIIATHWIPRMSILVSDPMRLPNDQQKICPHFRFNRKGHYLPLLHVHHFGVSEKDFQPVNTTTNIMALKISNIPATPGKMLIMLKVEDFLKEMKNESAGCSNAVADYMKDVFFYTDNYLLHLALLLHCSAKLFDVLALESDISFWRKRKSIVGLSLCNLVWQCISQTIWFVFLFFLQFGRLTIVLAGISVLVEFWKITRVLKMNIRLVRWRMRFRFGAVTDEEVQSDAYDTQGFRYLMRLTGLGCVVRVLYALLYSKSFFLSLEIIPRAASSIGLIFTIPQLYVNYKLKSAAHLNWKVLAYNVLKAVADDLLFSTLTAPTSRHIGEYITFAIYLYQSWLYPVEKTEATKYGENLGGDDGDTKVKSE